MFQVKVTTCKVLANKAGSVSSVVRSLVKYEVTEVSGVIPRKVIGQNLVIF